MNVSFPHAAAVLHERLARYLQEDPGNPALLADACDAAITAGEHGHAKSYVATAHRLGLAPAEWTLRQARVCLPLRELPEARALLEQLRSEQFLLPLVTHDLAYICFLEGDLGACLDCLRPWAEPAQAARPAVPPEELGPIQLLWLRALHGLGQTTQAWQWIQEQRRAGNLQQAGVGAASLIALDCDHFESARSLADDALTADPLQLEALVARGCVAIAEGNNQMATQLLQRALGRSPLDGRIWSALGLASLQARHFPIAQTQLETAVRTLPGHIGSWHALGWARLFQQDTERALEAFRQALALDGNFAESHGALGLALALSGRKDQADHHLTVAERLDRKNVTGRYARAVLAGGAGSPEDIERLTATLLARPGFFRGDLADAARKGVRQST